MGSFLRALASLLSLYALLSAQGPGAKASADDWEEINFEFGSSVLTDGFPTLIRIADLLKRNPKFSVSLTGYADAIGSDAANDAISAARAESVKAFLLARGARAAQIAVAAQGRRNPAAANDSREGRFVNRRVAIAVRNELGAPIGAGTLGTRLRPIETPAPAPVEPRQANAPPPGCYGVQIGTFRERANAERFLPGAAGPRRIQLWNAGAPLWRLIVGCEATEQAAGNLARQLRDQAADAFVVHVSGAVPEAEQARATGGR